MCALPSVLLLCLLAPVDDPPRSTDPSVTVELFAQHPQLVTPTGIAVDSRGRVFVAESHTHFRPDDYDGPAADRILILEDRDGDGRADARTIFHEGYTHVMDLAFNREGWLYVATRMDIHRMRDTDDDGMADEIIPVVRMETTGTYPHNGISGLCFNSDGTLNFGLGENLGHDYTMVGTDEVRRGGGGEGGSTWHVHADGTKLRRVTTGWWNPFGMCVDRYGRVFGTDNDPGASPPCRLIQVHEHADYAYEYRYGRTGLHPLISWTGELPGAIPMIAGTGEAPCGILACERTSLPRACDGNLLVASWADHAIERYILSQTNDSGQVQAVRHALIVGSNDFRPVGLAVAPDGSVFVSDWVLASYQLHSHGRIWRIRGPEKPRADAWVAGPETPRETLTTIASTHAETPARAAAVRELLRRGGDAQPWATAEHPAAVRALALPALSLDSDGKTILRAADSSDPVIRHAAIEALAAETLEPAFRRLATEPSAPVLLAMKRSKHRQQHARTDAILSALDRPEQEVWGVAVKWIADDLLTNYRARLLAELKRDSLTVRQYLMVAAALDTLDGNKPSDIPAPKQLAATALDDNNNAPLRVAAMRLLRPDNRQLATKDIVRLTESETDAIRVEALRLLTGREEAAAFVVLLRTARDSNARLSARLQALAALAPVCNSVRHELVSLSADASDAIALAALQSLTGTTVTDEERGALIAIRSAHPTRSDAVDRVIGASRRRPAADATDAWLAMLVEEGDVQAGERIFFHTRIGTCSRCHQHGGRGVAVGPGLDRIARRLPGSTDESKRWLLQTILQPGQDMAPQYTPWIIVTRDGKQLTGLPRRKGGNAEAYLGVDGREFTVKKSDIEFHRESRTSLMPEGLLQNLTEQELRDLFAFLLNSK